MPSKDDDDRYYEVLVEMLISTSLILT